MEPIIFPFNVRRLPVDWYGMVYTPINTKIIGYAIPVTNIINNIIRSDDDK